MKNKISEFIRAASNLTDDNIGVFSDFIQSKLLIPNPYPWVDDNYWDRGTLTETNSEISSSRKPFSPPVDPRYNWLFTNFIYKHVNLSRVSEKNIHQFFKDNDHINPQLYVLKRMENKDDDLIAFVSEEINRAGVGKVLDRLKAGNRKVVYKGEGGDDIMVLSNPNYYQPSNYGVVINPFYSEDTKLEYLELGTLVFLNYVDLYPEKINARLIGRFYSFFPTIPASSFFVNTLLNKADLNSINIDFSNLDHFQKISLMSKAELRINTKSIRTIFKSKKESFPSLYSRMKKMGVTYDILKKNGLFDEFMKSEFGEYCNRRIIEDVHRE